MKQQLKPPTGPLIPEMHHFFSQKELETCNLTEMSQLSATTFHSQKRKFHGSTGCTCAGVRSITIRTCRRNCDDNHNS